MPELSDRFNERIREKTGLKTEKAIEAYNLFYTSAGFDRSTKGVIMSGDVRSKFNDIIRKKFGARITPSEEKKIIKIGNQKYGYWLKYFQRKELVSDFRKPNPKSQYCYPMLWGYNPLNDTEFYIPCRDKGKTEWTGRMPIEIFKERKYLKKFLESGYEFKGFRTIYVKPFKEKRIIDKTLNGS